MKTILKYVEKVLSKEVSILGVVKSLAFVSLPTFYVVIGHAIGLTPISDLVWILLTICFILLAIIHVILRKNQIAKDAGLLDIFLIKYNIHDEFNPNIKARISLGMKNRANYPIHGVEINLFDITSSDENYSVMINQVISNDINIIDGKFSINANSNKGNFLIGDLIKPKLGTAYIDIVTGNELRLVNDSLYNFNFVITGELLSPVKVTLPVRYIADDLVID